MKITKILNDYPKLKEVGAVSIETTNTKEKVLKINRYDQYTGEVVGRNIISIDKKEINKQITELEEKIESLKLLRKDLK